MWKFTVLTLAILLLAHSKGVQCVISEGDSQHYISALLVPRQKKGWGGEGGYYHTS